MKSPIVSRRRYDADLLAAKAETSRMRSERDKFAEARDANRAAARTASRQFTDADEELAATRIVNACLTEDVAKERQVNENLARQIHEMADRLRAYERVDGTDWQSKYEAERKRADRLQKRLDDAVGLKPSRIEDSSQWQPANQVKKGGLS